jgi:hypothetical protein
MSLDSAKPEEIRVKFRGTPKQYLIELDKKYYSVTGHSPAQAMVVLGMKQGGGWKKAEETKKRMKVIKEL